MIVKSVTPIQVAIVETDADDFPTHTRYGPNTWMVTMGMSEEIVTDCFALETAYQTFISNFDNEYQPSSDGV